jgi:phosphatidylserine/phosphatidylglycerophosphate/cardiolipin synthase-like enzyme
MAQLISKDVTGLRVVAYPGANSVLIAMSVPDDNTANLAGFAIWRQRQGEAEQAIPNRLNFDDPVTSATTPQQRKWTPSDQAPFQKFRWVDIPPDGTDKPATYRVCAMYFTGQGKAIKKGPEASVVVPPVSHAYTKFRAAFTRGYISSQAYADKFQNADIRPAGPKTPDFDTKPYEAQYAWLGAGGREQLFAFIDDCRNDKTCKVDVFAYDLDEPDVVAAICEFGREKRLRVVLDNAKLHTGATAPEVRAAALITQAAGPGNVVQGHFSRFQHNKVFIKRDSSGAAQRVLFGSMNFSVRGIYVQSNNIIIADDPTTAGFFLAAFEDAFANKTSTAKFSKDTVAQGYNLISAAATPALPKSKVALSPHADPSVSLGPAAERVRAATGSVLYAVMQPKGTGEVLGALQTIAAKPTVFSYGTVETAKGLAVQRGDGVMGEVADFAFLKSKVPYPFSTEFTPGAGMHIHDKFIVVDFNGDNPAVFTGSSNLAEGGEKANGDSLIMIEDQVLASVYAIEALKIFDHFSFRDKMMTATTAQPLILWYPGKADAAQPWWTPAYDQNDIKYRDRCLFAAIPLAATLQSHKDVDWSSIGSPAPGAGPKKSKPASGGSGKKKGPAKASKVPEKKTKPAAKKTKPAAKKKPPRKGAVKKKGPAKKATAKKAAKKVAKKGAAKRPAAKRSPAKKASKRAPAKKAKKGRGK